MCTCVRLRAQKRKISKMVHKPHRTAPLAL
jgi:hypothetical protein